MKRNGLEDVVPGVSTLTNAELDQRLERAVVMNQESEKLVCCFLSAMRDRGAYRDFGFSSIYDYARERFGFKERKTRYLLLLGRKLEELPQLRKALQSEKLGWCKAVRVASVATREDETMWLDSALSLTVQELDRRIKDGTERLAGWLHFWVSEDVRVLWENGLETARRVAGVELSPAQALEYMIAEFLATWGGAMAGGCEEQPKTKDAEALDAEAPAPEGCEDVRDTGEAGAGAEPQPLFPFAEAPPVEEPPGLVSAEVENAIARARQTDEDEFRKRVLERDQWRCRYPGCSARRELGVQHIVFRSHCGPDELWNGVVLCAFHHRLLHAGQIAVKGRAPHELEWTQPKLMREVLERRRNRPAIGGELEVWEFPQGAPALVTG